ncbi:MAG: hypothetical protein HN472_17525 [Nitrospina sp.]|nr:hypothetical protein [Nitrospina sp.]MBT3511329.1 hypothetical protein [Nitrospina sp.]MBT3875120.1 hypothetical protein [Nitrospina sp.]MBT4047447.1 hypothetical protein [Nitrospina sp.]MBT4558196.1 hypothetical protein [Nitrospina sp.]
MASQTIDILCGKCGAFMIRYQKKGAGQLIRLYLDKVTEPDSLSRLKSVSTKSDLPTLACVDCGNRIGLAMAPKGGRWAYRMIKGSFRRKRGV